MPLERIVSFLPSATEVLYNLGVGNQIVGVTHECIFPANAKTKPHVIHCSFASSKMSSNEIDKKIVELMRSGKDIYVIDDHILKNARPDLIIAQGLCEVCSPFTKEINKAVRILDEKPDILILDPHDLDDILISIMDIAERIGAVKEGRKLVASLQKRIDIIQSRPIKIKPKVLCIEWIDPLFIAGHWVPQMVEIAGGINGLSSRGEPSHRITTDDVMNFDPDIMVLMPCGFDLSRTLKEFASLENMAGWKSLRAVQNNNVYSVNARAYFSKPSPRAITGLEVLAKIINPDAFKEVKIPMNSFKRMINRI